MEIEASMMAPFTIQEFIDFAVDHGSELRSIELIHGHPPQRHSTERNFKALIKMSQMPQLVDATTSSARPQAPSQGYHLQRTLMPMADDVQISRATLGGKLDAFTILLDTRCFDNDRLLQFRTAVFALALNLARICHLGTESISAS